MIKLTLVTFILCFFNFLLGQNIDRFHINSIKLRFPNESNHEAFFIKEKSFDDQEVLWRYIKELNKLEIFNIKSLSILNNTQLETSGPNQTGIVFGFYPISNNLIYLINLTGELILFDIQKGVISKNNLLENIDDINSLVVTSINANRVIFQRDNHLFLPISPKNPNIYDDKNKFFFYIDHNIDNNISKYLPVEYPKEFFKDGLKNLNYHSVYLPESDELIILPVNYDHFIVSNCENKIEIKSPSNREVKSPYSNWQGILKDDKAIINKFYDYSINIGLVYDPYRKLVYKIFWPGANMDKYFEKVSFEDIRRLRFPFFNISVYNLNLEFLGVYKSSDYKYNSNQMFVGKEGLYIQADHSLNPESNEDNINFHVFDFTKK